MGRFSPVAGFHAPDGISQESSGILVRRGQFGAHEKNILGRTNSARYPEARVANYEGLRSGRRRLVTASGHNGSR